MDRETERRQLQLDFVLSGEDIVIGDEQTLPLPLTTLLQTNEQSSYVVKSYTGGLTAKVYHIRIAGKDWNLKLKREPSLVKNVDGETSFLNEVQRRRDFQILQQNPDCRDAFSRVVTTRYASFRQGIMVSPWLKGHVLNEFNESVLSQLFDTLVNFELQGFMEWDLSPGNIVYDGHQVSLFDFGYCYRFDPLTEFNSGGLTAPLFHSVERLETRNFFGYLLRQEENWSERQIMALFELEKRLALQAYEYKYYELKRLGAQSQILDWLKAIIQRWRIALSTATSLDDLFLVESFRSHLLDVYDDLHGESCTAMTLKRLTRIEQILQNRFTALKRLDGLFFGDEKMSQSELLMRTAKQRAEAQKFQLCSQH
jgi:hypothetical protein